MKKRYILFDLDGTLTDPKLGITSAVAYALRHYGIEVENLDSLTKFIGPPLVDSFMDFYGFSQEQAQEAVGVYREYFSTKGLFENSVYDGIPEMLHTLREDGRTLLVATSKPTVFSVKILEHFDLLKYFDFVSGSELDGRRSIKHEVIEYALEQMGITDRDACVMVGDRRHDIIGAKASEITSVGVLFGYGDFEEHAKAGADLIARDVAHLTQILLDC